MGRRGFEVKLPSVIPPELLRFAIVIVAGLGIDLGTGFCLVNYTNLPLTVGAAAGFFVGAAFNYILHEFWTFRTKEAGLSSKRAVLYLTSSLITLGVRVSVAKILSPLAVSRLMSFAVLLAAAGASFIVNYVLSRFVVYSRRTERASLAVRRLREEPVLPTHSSDSTHEN